MSLPAQKPIGFLPIRTQLVSKLSYKLFCSEFVNLANSIPVFFFFFLGAKARLMASNHSAELPWRANSLCFVPWRGKAFTQRKLHHLDEGFVLIFPEITPILTKDHVCYEGYHKFDVKCGGE